jgi:hypothetical protein
MTDKPDWIENESTAKTPLGPRFVGAIKLDAAKTFGWEWEDVANGVATLEIPPNVLINYVAWWLREHGVSGWSKLRLDPRDYPPTDEDIERIKKEGPQSA